MLARTEHLEAARVSAGEVDGILSAVAAVLNPGEAWRRVEEFHEKK